MIRIKELCVQKFEGPTRLKILGILQTEFILQISLLLWVFLVGLTVENYENIFKILFVIQKCNSTTVLSSRFWSEPKRYLRQRINDSIKKAASLLRIILFYDPNQGALAGETKRPYIRTLRCAMRGCLQKATAMRPNAIFFLLRCGPESRNYGLSLVSLFRIIRTLKVEAALHSHGIRKSRSFISPAKAPWS